MICKIYFYLRLRLYSPVTTQFKFRSFEQNNNYSTTLMQETEGKKFQGKKKLDSQK